MEKIIVFCYNSSIFRYMFVMVCASYLLVCHEVLLRLSWKIPPRIISHSSFAEAAGRLDLAMLRHAQEATEVVVIDVFVGTFLLHQEVNL